MDRAVTIGDVLRVAERILSSARIRTARLDAEVLLAASLAIDRTRLYACLRDPVNATLGQRFPQLISRRLQREPVAYIVGRKEFCSLEFAVEPGVLIPRPETEHLVEATVARLRQHPHPTICDVGTGSGCVAVAVAHALPAARVLATDISRVALRIARWNAERHEVAGRIRFVAADCLSLFAPAARFAAIVSNPPYLRPVDGHSPELKWEPREALAAGSDGLTVIRELLSGSPALLEDGGFVVVEIGYGQAADAVALARRAGLERVTVDNDLAGIPRVLIAHASS
jgi:release factor glutamine methyltransferase